MLVRARASRSLARSVLISPVGVAQVSRAVERRAEQRATRLLVVGDSLSEGVGDPAGGIPGLRGQLRGWVARLADACAQAGRPLDVTNLAVRGADVARVRSTQLGRGLSSRPDASVCFIGVNDVFRPGFDPVVFGDDYRMVVSTLVSATTGPVVVMTLHDVVRALPLPGRTRQRVRDRVRAANAVIGDVATRTGAVVIDTGRFSDELAAGGLLSIDRLHPNAAGHRRIAAEVLDVLRGVPELGLHGVRLPEVRGSEVAHAWWLVRHGPGLLWRGGALPDLLRRGRRG